MEFKQWFLENTSLVDPDVTPEETTDLQGIDEMSPVEQAQLDIDLHRKALSDDKFNAEGEQKLAADMETKQKFIRLMRREAIHQDVAKAMASDLQRDMDIHRKYLQQPASEKTGSHGWHKTWLNVYSHWIEEMERLILST